MGMCYTAKKENSRIKEKADRKRSQSIDKSLKAEKREYKQTHRLLLLGEREQGWFVRALELPDPLSSLLLISLYPFWVCLLR
uniref:Uncharacterized protein n=1 Tax=Naja naja TaxID=35670 RepID=A0A8C6VGN7_NAJNA